MQLTIFAYLIRVSFIAWSADTQGSMIVDPTFSVDSASCCSAWIHTLISDTCFGLGTVWVNPTFRLRRGCEKQRKKTKIIDYMLKTNAQ